MKGFTMRPSKIGIVILALLFSISFSACTKTGKYPLTPAYKAGKTYIYKIENTSTVHTSMGQTPINIQVALETSFTEKLLSVDDNGNRKIECVIGDFKIDMDMGFMKVSVDTAGPDKEDKFKMMDGLKRLVGIRLISTVDPQWNVIEIEGKEQWDEAMRSMAGSDSKGANSGLSSILGDDFLEKMSGPILAFPKEPVEVGGSWTSNKEWSTGLGKMAYKEDLTLVKVEKGIATIDSVGTFSGDFFGKDGKGIDAGPGGKIEIESVKMNNHYLFCVNTERVKSVVSNSVMEMAISNEITGKISMKIMLVQKTTLVE